MIHNHKQCIQSSFSLIFWMVGSLVPFWIDFSSTHFREPSSVKNINMHSKPTTRAQVSIPSRQTRCCLLCCCCRCSCPKRKSSTQQSQKCVTKLTSSNIVTRNDSEASCRARMAVLWKRRSGTMDWATSLTKRWKGSFLIKRSVDFWYFRIWRRATVPGR